MTVREREPGGVIQIDAANHGHRRSLRTRDRVFARKRAHKLSEQLAVQRDPGTPVTVGLMLRLYLEGPSRLKGHRERWADKTRAKLWERFLGADTEVVRVNISDWAHFGVSRRAGYIDGAGRVKGDQGFRGRPVRARTIQADMQFFSIVCNWATSFARADGSWLLAENPVARLKMPREKNVQRPVMSHSNYLRLVDVAPQVRMSVRVGNKRCDMPSWLPQLLEAQHESGRRIEATCSLTLYDLRLDAPRPDHYPENVEWHGAICWPADTDKWGKEWLAPVTRRGAEVLREQLAVTGHTRMLTRGVSGGIEPKRPVFPSPSNFNQPMSRFLAADWLTRACTRAGIYRIGWHSIRRKWASDRRDRPPKDVARLGGWENENTMLACYTHSDLAGAARALEVSRG